MRDPTEWLAAAMYDAVRRMLPRIFFTAWGKEVQFDHWDHAPQKIKDAFIGFAIVLREIVEKEFGDAVTESTEERESEEEAEGYGPVHE
jgi:hypothetical protein